MKKKIFKLLISCLILSSSTAMFCSGEGEATKLSLNASIGVDGEVEAGQTKSVSISKKKATINKGFTYKLKLSNVPKGSKVKWSTSSKAVASVKASGSSCVVTGKKTGKATITAKVGSKKYTCKVTVKAQTALSETFKSLIKGKTFTLSLKNTVPGTIKWTCSSNQVVKITKKSRNQYQVKALKAGTAYVVARLDGKAYKCKVVATNAAPTLSRTSGSITYGKTGTVTLNNAVKTVKWSVGDSSILKISASGSKKQKCTVKGLKAGKTTLKAVSNGKTYKCTITVKAASNPVISKKNLNLWVGETDFLLITRYNDIPSWKSSNQKVAAVSISGQVVAISPGTAKITASMDGVTRTCKVTVKENPWQSTATYEPLKLVKGEGGDSTKYSKGGVFEVGEMFSLCVNNPIKNVSISAENDEVQSLSHKPTDDMWDFQAVAPGKGVITITDIYNQKLSVEMTVTQEIFLKDDNTRVKLTGTRKDNSLPIPTIKNIYCGNATIPNPPVLYLTLICPGTFSDSDSYYGYEVYSSGRKEFDNISDTGMEDRQWNNLGYARMSLKVAKGQTCYIKIRSYTLDGTVKVCGPWSKTYRFQVPNYSTRNPENKAQYTYDMFYLNQPGMEVYDSCMQAIYIKTDNPEPSTIDLVSDGKSILFGNPAIKVGHYYENIRYLDMNDYNESLKKVDGGYVGYYQFKDPGTHHIELRECTSKGYVTVKKIACKVLDYDKGMDDWVNNIIKKYTTTNMTPFEKMDAINEYLNTPGLFKYLTQSNGENVILTSMPNDPFFVTYRWDSYTSPAMLCEFAERIGGFDDIHNCYGDYDIGSSEWSNTHYLARLTIGNDVRYYEACPPSSTGDVGEIKYIDFSDTSKFTPAD